MKKSETKGNMTWNNVSTCKVHINVLLTVHLSDQSTLQTPAYKLAKFLVPVLEILTTNKYADMIQFILKSLLKKPLKFALINFLKTATLFKVRKK